MLEDEQLLGRRGTEFWMSRPTKTRHASQIADTGFRRDASLLRRLLPLTIGKDCAFHMLAGPLFGGRGGTP